MSQRKLIEKQLYNPSNISYGSIQSLYSHENEKTKDKPQLLNDGLRDRPILSLIRIILVAATWWIFVVGFSCLCFLLMTQVLYESDNTQPYFVLEYPGILHQPGLNIRCSNIIKDSEDVNSGCDTNQLSIRINKMFNWIPEPYTREDDPAVMANMEEDMKEMGMTSPVSDSLVYVTCNGRNQVDKDNLQGMKMTSLPGFPIGGFPWLGNNESWLEPATLDLGSSLVAKRKNNTQVYMECRAWAKNIKHKERVVDKKIPNGGGLAVLCFYGGKIYKIGHKNC